LSDVGLLGAAAALLLLAAWLVAAARATGLQPRPWWRPAATARPAWTSERSALVALTLAAIVYGVQSATDWTWFVPGVTVTALVAAGFVAGRGRLGGAPPTAPSSRLPTAARLSACAAIALIAVVCGWAIWQPVAADRAVARSYAATGAGEPVLALREAADARDLNPHSVDPYYAAAAALTAIGRDGPAIASLRRAATERPRDPEPWLQIATIELDRQALSAALAAAEQTLRRDPYSARIVAVRDGANALLARRRTAAAPPVPNTTP